MSIPFGAVKETQSTSIPVDISPHIHKHTCAHCATKMMVTHYISKASANLVQLHPYNWSGTSSTVGLVCLFQSIQDKICYSFCEARCRASMHHWHCQDDTNEVVGFPFDFSNVVSWSISNKQRVLTSHTSKWRYEQDPQHQWQGLREKWLEGAHWKEGPWRSCCRVSTHTAMWRISMR